MKYFYLDRDIEGEMFRNTIDFFNSNADDTINIILDSNGGSSHLAAILVSIINRNPEKFILTSVKTYSAAFTIFYATKCAKQIVRNTMGCYHLSYLAGIDLNARNKPVWTGQKAEVKNFLTKEAAIGLDFMTAKEKRKFDKGGDVYFNFQRMKEIFPEAEII